MYIYIHICIFLNITIYIGIQLYMYSCMYNYTQLCIVYLNIYCNAPWRSACFAMFHPFVRASVKPMAITRSSSNSIKAFWRPNKTWRCRATAELGFSLQVAMDNQWIGCLRKTFLRYLKMIDEWFHHWISPVINIFITIINIYHYIYHYIYQHIINIYIYHDIINITIINMITVPPSCHHSQ